MICNKYKTLFYTKRVVAYNRDDVDQIKGWS